MNDIPDCDRRRLAWAEKEIERLRSEVITFGALWAAQYARDHRLPDGHLYAVHYDALQRAGARMVNFTRA